MIEILFIISAHNVLTLMRDVNVIQKWTSSLASTQAKELTRELRRKLITLGSHYEGSLARNVHYIILLSSEKKTYHENSYNSWYSKIIRIF